VIGAIIASRGARQALPGEFTLRAFLHGRVDLTQAEAVLGVIDATEGKSLDVALQQLAGGMTRPLAQLRTDLLELLADLEAGFDFSEEDIVFVSREEIAIRARRALDQVVSLLTRVSQRHESSISHRVVLLGEPNAGKSSLYNRIMEHVADRNASKTIPHHTALVSDVRGTTRDYLETFIRYAGTSILLTDTPGLERIKPGERFSLDTKSQESTAIASADADLVLFCADVCRMGRDFPTCQEKQFLDRHADAILVLTKCDQFRSALDREPQADGAYSSDGANVLRTSAATGEGINSLLETIQERLRGNYLPCEAVVSTAVRCRGVLEDARAALESVCLLCQEEGDEAVIASELRIALEKIGLVTGEVHTDDILENIFSRFCVGK
ncbi:MAG: 50S ribosome-binding GTPase, partial [Thermoguttaceae bacterium]|nr:50S ribosome-binding GTPase [Thermoguttaceae bacterium]